MNNTGTLVISPVRPQAQEDTFPSAYANEIKGGHHQVSTLTDRDTISSDRRIEGMLCYVVAEQKLYRLLGGVANGNWTEVTSGQGPQGHQGEAGTGLVNRGNWVSGEDYLEGDYVFDESTLDEDVNSMWICQLDIEDSATQPKNDLTHWVEFSAPQGPQGYQGAQGDIGYQGAQGNQGVQGTQGSQGNQGNQGHQGNQGYTGFQGNQGYQGDDGEIGDQGPQGQTGPQGSHGNQGNQGAQGNQGNQGNQGGTGPQGLRGYQGFQGVQGSQGSTGFQGTQGNQGAQGNQGYQGYTGPQGTQGNSGTGLTNRGAWVSGEDYVNTDYVFAEASISETDVPGPQPGTALSIFLTWDNNELIFEAFNATTSVIGLEMYHQAGGAPFIEREVYSVTGGEASGEVTKFRSGLTRTLRFAVVTNATSGEYVSTEDVVVYLNNRIVPVVDTAFQVDVVNQNSMWICQLDIEDSTTEPKDDPTHWVEFLAPQGPQGYQGTAGFQGNQGYQGSQGNQGSNGIGDHSLLTNLNWSTSGHTIDQNIDLGEFFLKTNSLLITSSGYEYDPWVAQDYDVDDGVRHNGFNYICIEAAGPTDEPGIATDKWEEDGVESLASPAILYNNSDSPNSLLNIYKPDSKELFFIGLNENGIDLDTQHLFVGDFRMLGNSFVAGTDISSLYDSKPETYIKTLINIGNNINATENGLAIGQNITTDYGFAFGIDINTTGSAAFGGSITGNGAVALGFIIDASNRGSALGRQITFDGEQDIGAGVNLTVTGDYSIAIGNDITVTGDKSLCIGYGNSVLASNSSLIGGSGNCNNGDYSSMSGGQNNECDGTNSFVAGGSGNEATGNYTSAISSMDCMVSGLMSSVYNSAGCIVDGDGSIALTSVNSSANGYGAFIAVSEECLANSYGAVIVNSIYSSVTGFGSSIYNSTAVNVGAVWTMAIDSVYLEVEDLTFFNFATNAINSVIRDPLAGLPIPDWADDTSYTAGDYVRSNANFSSTNFGYVCIQSHTSTEATRPESGENWADYWQLFTSARSIILGGDDIDITGAYNSNFNGIGNTIGGNFNYSFGSGNTIVGDRNMLINLRQEALTQIGDETILLNGTLQVNTGSDSYIKSDELFVDLGALLEDYALYIPIIETKAHETSEVLGLNYATGLYDKLAIFDKSDTDRVGIIFSKQDFFLTSPVGQIDYNISEDRFEIIGDWCPDSVDYEDEIYRSLGQNTLKWKDLFVRDKIKIGDTELTEADLIALKALL